MTLRPGRFAHNVPLCDMTWFRVGGPAEVLYKPSCVEDLQDFLSKNTLPFWILGAGSNVLVRDGGVPGVTLRLSRGFSSIERDGDVLIVGAGCLDRTLALYACEAGLSGFEFLIGIPGTIGGAVIMNAGAYGREIKDGLLWVDVLDRKGELIRLSEFSMTYRCGHLPKGSLVVRAAFQGSPKSTALIRETCDGFLRQREMSQPVRGRTGGSTFKNPEGGLKAWEYIDKAGCRGQRRGDAQISEKHCNFLLNLDRSTANDLEALAEDVRAKVYQAFGLDLTWEILRTGVHQQP